MKCIQDTLNMVYSLPVDMRPGTPQHPYQAILPPSPSFSFLFQNNVLPTEIAG